MPRVLNRSFHVCHYESPIVFQKSEQAADIVAHQEACSLCTVELGANFSHDVPAYVGDHFPGVFGETEVVVAFGVYKRGCGCWQYCSETACGGVLLPP